ncbi:hypothetical protein BGZ83_002088 [Gryganskiella cystojenkinii]|nr:hypothetical protein BGZ83_002088 [Gryganskiella cystojenkinii]
MANNNNDPRFNNQGRPGFGPGQVPPFIDPRNPNNNHGFPHQQQQQQQPGGSGRYPIPPVRFPGQQPQFPGAPPRVGGPPMVHQPGQFQNMNVHQQFMNQQQRPYPQPPLPTGQAFHNMVHQQNMYPTRTSSGNSSPIASPPLPSPQQQSPTSPIRAAPSRSLPPVPKDDHQQLQQQQQQQAQASPRGESDSYLGSAQIATDSILLLSNSNSTGDGDKNKDDSSQSLRSEFREIRDTVDALRGPEGEESVYEKTLRKGVDVAIAATATATTGETLLKQGMAVANKALEGKAGDIISKFEANPALNHLIQLADKLVDVGKAVPFIAPAFVILKIIIDVERKARDADAKCNDLLERINFMVSNITVLEKVKVIDPLVAVIEKMNSILKSAATLIQTYRKQGAISRRLNMSNGANFTTMAEKITRCSQDLMLSLQIQQTGDISILTRSVPQDSQDLEAQKFVATHGGQDAVKHNPALVEEYAKKMQLTMSDQVMEQMQSSMEDLLEENQSRIEHLMLENSSNTVAMTIKAMATEAREQEAEQRLTCLQCDKEYRESGNGPQACSFHKSTEVDGSFSCCGNRAGCTFSNHRSVHHCEYPYSSFFKYAYGIVGYSDTTDDWIELKEHDLITNEYQKASVSKLLRWRSYIERIPKNMIVIHVGSINFDTPYYFQTFDAEALQAVNEKVKSSGKSVIFRTEESEEQFSMAEWTLSADGDINGVKLTCKVATSEKASVSIAPIDVETAALSGEVQVISKAKFSVYAPAELYKFPETIHKGHVLRDTPLRAAREFKAQTKLPLVVIPSGPMVANTEGRFVRNNADKFQGRLGVFNKALPVSQTYVTLASAKAEYRFVGEEHYQEVESLTLGDIKFPYSIAPTQTVEIPFEAIVKREKEQAELMQNCWQYAMIAIHRPVRVRLTFKDIEGEEMVYVQEYVYNPRGLAKKDPTDLLFLHLDDEIDGSRTAIKVKKADGEYIVNINGNSITAEGLNKIVYRAEQSGETEVDMKFGRDCGSYKWDAWALVDLSCRRVYGFKVLMVPGPTRTKKNTATLGYAACPLYGGDDLEERPIQYAEEKIQFPEEIENSEEIKVVVDDTVDDEKIVVPEAVQAVAVPVVSIATAATSSVAAAINEVSKATSSLDTAVFSASMSTLEKRLESLDVNVSRMATALEKLVDILSH